MPRNTGHRKHPMAHLLTRGAIAVDADAVPLQGKAGWSRGRGLIRMLSPRPTLRLTDL